MFDISSFGFGLMVSAGFVALFPNPLHGSLAAVAVGFVLFMAT